MSLFGRLIKHGLLFVTRMVVGFQIYFNSLNNSARLNYARKICLITEVMFKINCFFHFLSTKVRLFWEIKYLHKRNKKCSFGIKLKIMIFKNAWWFAMSFDHSLLRCFYSERASIVCCKLKRYEDVKRKELWYSMMEGKQAHLGKSNKKYSPNWNYFHFLIFRLCDFKVIIIFETNKITRLKKLWA